MTRTVRLGAVEINPTRIAPVAISPVDDRLRLMAGKPKRGAERLGALGLNFGSGAGSVIKSGAAGASAGSIIPGVGNVIGGAIGTAYGVVKALTTTTKDPENATFETYHNTYNGLPYGAARANYAASIGNPYIVWAGYMDLKGLKGPQPIYSRYGRMGEQKFFTDLINQTLQAQAQGINDPNAMWSQVIGPWIAGFGNWPDPNAQAMTDLIQYSAVPQIMGGQFRQNFKARGGDMPFSSIQAPTVAAPQQMVAAPSVPTASSVPFAPASSVPMAPPAQVYSTAPASLAPVAIAPTSGGAPDMTALLQQMMAQGASQQQAFAQAMSTLQAQGVPPTPQVQQAVAQQVQAVSSGDLLKSPIVWVLGGGALLAVVLSLKRRS